MHKSLEIQKKHLFWDGKNSSELLESLIITQINMKILAIIGTFIGIGAICAALYLQFSVAETAAIAESTVFGEHDQSWYGSAEHLAGLDAMELKTNLGVMVMFAGILAFLLSIIPAIKKQKIAWLGVLTGLGAFVIGAAFGTHMFS